MGGKSPFEQAFYPILMFLAVWRTIVVRVKPNVLLVFKYFENDTGRDSATGVKDFFSKLYAGWVETSRLFSLEDKGQWETVLSSGDREVIRQGDWFRIGFEPVFADYTKSGTWYILFSLVEVGEDALSKNNVRHSHPVVRHARSFALVDRQYAVVVVVST